MVIGLVDLWVILPVGFHVWAVSFVVTFTIAIVALNLTFVVFVIIYLHMFSILWGFCV